jgi:protein involved in polysaccharide export with SLBB domain
MLLKKSVILLLCLLGVSAYAQQDSSKNVERIGTVQKTSLKDERNLNDPLSEVLKQKGVSLDKIDPTNVNSAKAVIQKSIGDVNKSSGATNAYREEVVSDNFEESVVIDDPRIADDIVRRLKDGSTFNEAITEELAENETHGASEIYGQHIFMNNTIEVYRGSSTGKIPGNYVLDAGDEIAINIFGISQADLVYQVDKDGFIRPTNIPKVYLKGVTLEEAKEIITKRFKMAYRYDNDQIAIDLKTARTISVSIFGQVTREGNYTLSALNSVLNALVLSDGLRANGSVRNIKIISDGVERVVDVYEFLYSGMIQPSYYLKNNDVIYVPIANNVITAKGQLRRIGKFELREGEGFKDLMLFTEGLTSNGRLQNIEILRKSRGESILINLDYEVLIKQNYKLQDLDELTVAFQDRRLENIISISGAVRNEGRFEWTEGMKLTDALAQGEVEKFSKLEVGYLVRKLLNSQFRIERIYPRSALDNPDGLQNIVLQKEDKITILNQKDYIHNYSFSIEGAVKRNLTHEWAPFQTLQLSDAILMAGGVMPNATTFGYIKRKTTYNSEKVEYVFIEIKKAMDDFSSEYNIKISPNDVIYIPTIELFNDELFISIRGSVRKPVVTTYDETLTLQHMITMAGGLTFEAASNRIDVYRLEVNENSPTRTLATSISLSKDINEIGSNNFELMPFDQIIVRNNAEFEPIKIVNISGEVRYPGPYAIVGDNYKLSYLIDAAGGVTREANLKGGKLRRMTDGAGQVITKMHKAMKREKSHYNLVLDEGDEITIPRTQSIIHIQTNATRAADVYSADILEPTLNVAFRPARRARYYISNYVGGFAKNAKRGRTVVETKSGRILKTNNFILFKIYPKVEPGSTIIAFAKVEKSKGREKRKQEKEQMTTLERIMQLQAVITVTTSTVTTAITSVLLIKSLQ